VDPTGACITRALCELGYAIDSTLGLLEKGQEEVGERSLECYDTGNKIEEQFPPPYNKAGFAVGCGLGAAGLGEGVSDAPRP
jgi:hypothetical protein